MRAKSGTWVAYQNQNPKSTQFKRTAFLEIGPACTYKEAPQHYPPSQAGNGEDYVPVGVVMPETGKIVSYWVEFSTPPDVQSVKKVPKSPWNTYVVRYWCHDQRVNDCYGNTVTWKGKARSPKDAEARARRTYSLWFPFRLHSVKLGDEVVPPLDITSQVKKVKRALDKLFKGLEGRVPLCGTAKAAEIKSSIYSALEKLTS